MSPAIRPRVRTVPLSGRSTPEMSLSRVLLPEPFSPSSPTASPSWTVRESSSSARKVSASGRPFTASTASSLSEWARCSTNRLEMRSSSMTVLTARLQLLREAALEPREGQLAEHHDHAGAHEGDEATGEEVGDELRGLHG